MKTRDLSDKLVATGLALGAIGLLIMVAGIALIYLPASIVIGGILCAGIGAGCVFIGVRNSKNGGELDGPAS